MSFNADAALGADWLKDAGARRKQAQLRGLAKRGVGAVWSYPGFVIVLLLVAPSWWLDQHRTALYLLVTVSGASSFTRVLLIWPWNGWIDRAPDRWWGLWAGSLLSAAVVWSLFFAWSFGPKGEIPAIIAISLAAFCAATMISTMPSWPLMLSFELIALLPSIAAAVYRHSTIDLGLAGLLVLYLMFILSQGRVMNRNYWASYDLQLSFRERSERLEEAVRLAEQRRADLAESEERHRIIFESSPLPMWLCDADSQMFVAVNDQAVHKYGYSRQEFLAMHVSEIEISQRRDTIPEFLSNQSAAGAAPMKQWRHRGRDGRNMDVEVTAYPIEWSGRKAHLVVSNDISDRLRAEHEKNAMEVQLRHAQKLESIGQLAAGVAHEINTPTQYIGDNLHFLQDAFNDVRVVIQAQLRALPLIEAHEELQPAAAEIRQALASADVDYLMDEMPKALEQAIDGVSRVSTLVRAMKEFSHPGTKDKSPADLNSAIQSTITVARNEWKYVAKLTTDLDPQLPMVPCFVSDFNQVVLNLIVNAAHAIAEAAGDTGVLGLIRVSTRALGQYVEIRIEDSGTGIPVHVRDRIFDPFFTTKEVGKGTGQGLAIARSVVVDKHGGTLDFETETGRGTTFIVRLPLDGATAMQNRGVISDGTAAAYSHANRPDSLVGAQGR